MKLNTLLKTLGFLALAATPVVAGTAPAPKQPAAVQPANDDLGVNVGLGYHTNYIWRGVNLGQNWVDGSIGGALSLAEGTRLAWDANYGSLASQQDHINPGAANLGFQRLQLGAALQKDVGPATLSLGYRYFRNAGDFNTAANMNDGQEVSLGLATSLGPINAATSANYDFVNDSWYFDLDLNTNIAVTDSVSVVPFFNVGYGKNFNWQFDKSLSLLSSGNGLTGWTAISTGFRFPIKLNSRATLTPYIAGNLPLGGTSNLVIPGSTLDTPFKSVLVGGVTLSVRF